MNICQRCLDAIEKVVFVDWNDRLQRFDDNEGMGTNIGGRIVSESACEFWAHQSYNRTKAILKAGIEDMGKEIFA